MILKFWFGKISMCYILQHISITSIPNLDFAIDIETPRAARKLLPSMCYIEYCSITSKIWVEVNDFREILLSCYILQHISVTSIPNLDFSVDIEASRVVRKLLPNMCYIEYWSVPSKNWTEVANDLFIQHFVDTQHTIFCRYPRYPQVSYKKHGVVS